MHPVFSRKKRGCSWIKEGIELHLNCERDLTYASLGVIGQLLSLRARTHASLERTLALVLATKGTAQGFSCNKKRFVEKECLVPRSKNRDLTASIPLVRSVITIGRSIAEFALVNTVRARLWPGRTVELVFRARDGGAVLLVGPVRAVLVAVAAPPRGDAEVVLTTELSAMAGREV